MVHKRRAGHQQALDRRSAPAGPLRAGDELAGKRIQLVVDPHTGAVVGVEDQDGTPLGRATPLDVLANAWRARKKPSPTAPTEPPRAGPNLVELAYRQYYGKHPASYYKN